jgi:hypothetical protein
MAAFVVRRHVRLLLPLPFLLLDCGLFGLIWLLEIFEKRPASYPREL